jgi:hypothetical protein
LGLGRTAAGSSAADLDGDATVVVGWTVVGGAGDAAAGTTGVGSASDGCGAGAAAGTGTGSGTGSGTDTGSGGAAAWLGGATGDAAAGDATTGDTATDGGAVGSSGKLGVVSGCAFGVASAGDDAASVDVARDCADGLRDRSRFVTARIRCAGRRATPR